MKEPLLLYQIILLSSVGLSVVHVNALETLDASQVSYFIVEASRPHEAYDTLRFIRGQISQDIYLKPVVFSVGKTELPREVALAADGFLYDVELEDRNKLNSWSAKLEFINVNIERLRDISVMSEANIAFKALRFIYTRDQQVIPTLSADNRVGYIYPQLAPLFPEKDTGQFEILGYLEDQRFLDSEFVNRSYSCTHCGCAFLNFYQVCSECGSSDLATEELIHHFKCAYVGELSDYVQGDKLVCPKCNSELKHLGADYDKASVVYRCNVCRSVSQDPDVMTVCYNCQRQTEPENQVVREIKSYTITSVGSNAALYGMDSLLQSILESSLEAVPYKIFKKCIAVEVERIERYKVSVSSMVLMRLDGVAEIYERMGARSSDIFNEVSTALHDQLRDSDLFCVKDENIFLILFTETSVQNAEIAVSRIQKRIADLLRTNLGVESRVNSNIEPIQAGLDVNVSVEKMLQQHDS